MLGYLELNQIYITVNNYQQLRLLYNDIINKPRYNLIKNYLIIIDLNMLYPFDIKTFKPKRNNRVKTSTVLLRGILIHAYKLKLNIILITNEKLEAWDKFMRYNITGLCKILYKELL